MSDLIDRIKKRIQSKDYHPVCADCCSKHEIMEILDEESAKEVQKCEWTYDCYYRGHTSCHVLTPYGKDLEFKYCPYCGRKIKVIEGGRGGTKMSELKEDEQSEMDKLIKLFAEHICDNQCRYPVEITDEEELQAYCCECEMAEYICKILNEYNKLKADNDYWKPEALKSTAKLGEIRILLGTKG